MASDDRPLSDYQNIFYGICFDNQDPMFLGRIRVFDQTDNYEARQNSSNNFNPDGNNNSNGPWSENDPFVFLPLLPLYVNQVPNNDQQVILFYFNNKIKGIRDKYYIIAPFSSPYNSDNESSKTSQTFLNQGTLYSKESLPNILDPDGKVPEKSKGVFAEPMDISFQGKDTADVIIKKNDVLLRAGKHKKFRRGEIPESDTKRAFLQLSKFDKKTTLSDPEIRYRLEKTDPLIKYLVEYDIVNTDNTQDAFTGDITIYNLSNIIGETTKSSFFDIDTDLSGLTLSKAYYENFIGLPMDDLISRINDILRTFLKTPNELLVVDIPQNSNFPFYYRPSKNVLSKITNFEDNGNIISAANVGILMNGVGIIPGDTIPGSPGYGLIMDTKLSPNIPFEPKKEIVINQTVESIDTTVGVLGASDLFFISHDSTIPGKSKIELGSDTLYGIDPEKIYTDLTINTSSTVRGEELLELLDVIVNFLITHVHPYPLLPPSAVSTDGTSTDDVLKRMLEAYEKVLNKKIRIN